MADLAANLLRQAHANEVDWEHVAPLLASAKKGQMPFVYFIGEEKRGHLKIGQAADPIARLRELQTGNPRRLRIDRLVWGDKTVEKLIHNYLREFRMSEDTEWFRISAHKRILRAADEIFREQAARFDKDNGITVEALLDGVGAALQGLGYTLRHEDKPMYLRRQTFYGPAGFSAEAEA